MRMVLWPNVSVYKHSVFFSNHFISVMVVVDLGAVELELDQSAGFRGVGGNQRAHIVIYVEEYLISK